MSYVYAVKLQSDKYYVGETSDYKIYEKMKMKSYSFFLRMIF